MTWYVISLIVQARSFTAGQWQGALEISRPIQIMLVDDHVLFRSGLKMLLEKEHREMKVTAEAATAGDALQLLEETEVDVVLMDISLPDLDGLAATRQINKLKPELKIIILTMHDDESYLINALEAGASGYVLKEAADTELITAVRATMEGDITIYPKMVKSLVHEALRERRDVRSRPGGKGEQSPQNDMLTEREEEVLHHICRGYTNREIADILHISIKTVEKHKEHIMQKLNLKKRHELIDFAIKKGLITFKEK